MRKTVFSSLAFKIGAIVILIEIVVLSVIGEFYFHQFSEAIDQRVEERAGVPGALMAEGLLSYSLMADGPRMERLVGQELVEGMVLNIAGRVFYTLDPEQMGRSAGDIPGPDPGWFTKETTKPFVKYILEDRINHLISVTPLFAMDGRTPFLFVYLKINTMRAEAEKAAILRMVLFGSVAAVLATSLVIFLVFRFSIFNRIQSMLQLLKRVEEGDLTVRTTGRIAADEIGFLQEDLNSMVSKLQKTFTSLQKSQEKYRRNEHILRRIIDIVPSYIFVKSADGRFIIANQALADRYGLTVEELTGKRHEEVHPDSEEVRRMLEHDRKVLASDRTLSIPEIPFQDHTGTLRWLEVTKTPGNEKEFGEPVVVGLAMDITERKQSKLALEESEQRYRTLFDEAPLMYVITEILEGIHYIKDVNNMVPELLGYSRDELAGTPLSRYYTEASQKKLFGKQGDGSALTEKDLPTECELLTCDGSLVHVLMHARPEYDEEGNTIGTRAMLLDVTERKLAEKENKRLEAQLVQAQKVEAIGTLAGGIAHDFNNILSAVIGYSELAVNDVPENSTVQQHLKKILAAGMRARDLVQQILTFSRKDERKLGLMNPAPLVKEAMKLLRSSLPATIEMIQNYDADVFPIMADPTKIHQIVMNLCTNAAHAMEPEGGRLAVILSQVRLSERDIRLHPGLTTGDYLKISVQDTGRGIPADVLPNIYDPYFSTKEKEKGTGLGLAVVHGIVQSFGGAIFAYSEAEVGTTFNVYIPSHKAQIDIEEEYVPDLPSGKEHILLVDDEPLLLDVGQQILERLGYRVSTVGESQSAIEMYRNAPDAFDLVMTDMTMPKMTGDKLSIELLKLKPDLPIILCTGYSTSVSTEEALEIGIKAFIYKPVVEAELARIVRKLLDER